MSSTVSHRIDHRTRRFAVIAALLTAGAAAAGLASLTGPAELSAPRTQGVESAKPWPGRLNAQERAGVAAALRSGDARSARIAGDVAAGFAGASALADPATLHHHGLNTATVPRDRNEAGIRFHHR
jgi:hypothetical protein